MWNLELNSKREVLLKVDLQLAARVRADYISIIMQMNYCTAFCSRATEICSSESRIEPDEQISVAREQSTVP